MIFYHKRAVNTNFASHHTRKKDWMKSLVVRYFHDRFIAGLFEI